MSPLAIWDLEGQVILDTGPDSAVLDEMRAFAGVHMLVSELPLHEALSRVSRFSALRALPILDVIQVNKVAGPLARQVQTHVDRLRQHYTTVEYRGTMGVETDDPCPATSSCLIS